MENDAPFHLKLKDSIHAHSLSSALAVFAATHATIAHPDESVEDLHWKSRAHRKRRYRKLDSKGRIPHGRETIWNKLGRFGKLEWKEWSWWIAVVCTTALFYESIRVLTVASAVHSWEYRLGHQWLYCVST